MIRLVLLLCLLAFPALAQHAIPFIPSTVVTGPASATSGNCASFNGTTGKIIQDAGSPCGGTSSFTKIQTLTASTSTSLDFTSIGGSTYNTLLLDCNALILSGNDTITLVVGEGGGPTWETGSTYLNQGAKVSAGTVTAINGTTDAKIFLMSTAGNNTTAGQPIGLKWYVNNVSSSSLYKDAQGQATYWTGAGTLGTYTGSGAWHGDTNALTGLRIISDAGATITSGQCSLYGVTP